MRLTKKHLAYMVKAEHLTAPEIASITGCTKRQVLSYANEYGIEMKRKPQGFKKQRRLHDGD